MTAERITLGLFLAGLVLCIATGAQLLYALLLGMACFGAYSLYKGNSFPATCRMLGEGMAKITQILLIFVFIGCLTASWRICGTIPFILYHSVRFIQPQYFILCTFLLCSVMSFLTGTSFGTFSTIGVICMLVGQTAGVSPLLLGGAILSGGFFGDRCSPMSSSAQLVCSITKTDIYSNVRHMMRSALVPFVLSCILYTFLAGGTGARPDTSSVALFREHFAFHWIVCLPAILILVLALLRVNVLWAMSASVLSAVFIALVLQGTSLPELLSALYQGYQAPEGTRLGAILNGGGISSMVHPGIIVLISASYSGIFSHTPLLEPVKTALKHQARRLGAFGTVTLAALLSCGVSCNQSLGTILTCQLCEDLYGDRDDLALALEDSAIVLAGLIPWGIAGAVPLATLGAPMASMAAAFYLWLIPVWRLLTSLTLHPVPGE